MKAASTTRKLFGQIAVARGYITERQLEDCLREQENASVELGQILLERGLITSDQFLDVLRLQERFVLVCRQCNRSYNVFGYHRGDVFPCGHCGKSLEVPNTAEEVLAERIKRPSRPALGRYQIVREIARGAMGLVLEALDTKLKRVVALKVLKEGDCEPKALERLHREAEAVAKLRHPNIVGIHDVGVENGVHYFAMDFVEGGALDQMIGAPERRVRELVAILEEVARAVDYAHRQGVVHRDLKPQNILIDKDGRPVVTDFGLARIEETSILLTRAGTALGTPYYMPPEQVLGKHAEIDARSDVWALGIILYQMLTKELPFDGATPVEIFRKILTEDPVKPRKLHPGIDPDLEIVCLKSMEKNATDRYRSAAEFAEDLRRWREGLPILARPSGVATHVLKRVRRNFARIAAIALLAVVVPGAYFLWRAVRSGREARRRAEASQRFSELYTQAVGRAEKLFSIQEGSASVERVHAEAEEVVRLFSEVLQLNENDARIYYYRGRLFTLLENDAQAEKDLQRAGDAESARFYLGRLFVDRYLKELKDPPLLCESGRWSILPVPAESEAAKLWRKKGEDELRRASSLRPHQGKYIEGVLAFGRGDYPVSAAALHEFCAAEWMDSSGLELFARALFMSGRIDEALVVLKKAVALSPSRPSLHRYYAMAREMKGDLAGADEEYTRAIDIEPSFAKAWDSRGTARLLMGRLEEALKDFERAVQLDPKNVDYLVHLGQVLFDLGDASGAERILTLAIELEADAEAYTVRGSVRAALRRHEAAIADHSKAIGIDPKNARLYVNRGSTRRDSGDLEGAVSDYTKALDLDENYALAYNNRGLVRRLLDDAEGAIQDCTRAIEIDPKFAEAYSNRAGALADLGDTLEALGDASKAIELDPRNPKLYVNRAIIHIQRGSNDKAIEDYTKVIELTPKSSEAHVNRGLVYWILGKNDKAFEDFARAIEQDSKDPRAYLGRGLVHVARQRYDKAFADLTRSIALNEKNPDAYRNRGEVYRVWGEYEKAIADLSKSLDLQADPDGYESRGLARRDWALKKTPLDKALLKEAIADFEKAIEMIEDEGEIRRIQEQIDECRKKLGN